jgi:hypothetical protein
MDGKINMWGRPYDITSTRNIGAGEDKRGDDGRNNKGAEVEE